MLLSQIPTMIPLPFASSGTKNAIPTPSQIGITAGAASLTDGFPPLTFTPISGGGVPPSGADFNGILNLITANTQWNNAGGFYPYSAVFSGAIGGYPKGAILARADGTGFWLSTADNNTNSPETVSAGWVPLNNNGSTTLALTNANVTLTPPQYAKPLLILTGTLTGNLQVIFPAMVNEWTVIDLTTGAFTVTLIVSGGTGVVSAQTGTPQIIFGDGTNIKSPLNSPTMTGVPTAPTASAGTNTTQLANTAFVRTAIQGKFLRRTYVIGNLGSTSYSNGNAPQVSGSYTVASDISFVIVKAQGSGGAAGGCLTATAGTYKTSGSGTAGNYVEKLLTVATMGPPGTVVNWKVGGQAASGGSSPPFSLFSNGGNGADTVFGVSQAWAVTAKGGLGGTGDISNGSVSGGTGPSTTGANGDFVVQGAPGGPGVAKTSSTFAASGDGGDSVFGGGTKGGFAINGIIGQTTGLPAYGAGLGGYVYITTGGANDYAGGAQGSLGVLIIEEYA